MFDDVIELMLMTVMWCILAVLAIAILTGGVKLVDWIMDTGSIDFNKSQCVVKEDTSTDGTVKLEKLVCTKTYILK